MPEFIGLDDLPIEHLLRPLPWWMRLRFWLRQAARDAVCAVRGHNMQWYGGMVDYETGETDADYVCARCGRGEERYG